MKMQYAVLKKKPRTLRSLTGFNADEFEALLPSFETAWRSFVNKQYPTQEAQGFCFGMSQSQANEWIRRLSGLLNQALIAEQCSLRMPVRTVGDYLKRWGLQSAALIG